MFKKVSIIAAAVLLAGCAQTKFHMQDRDDSLRPSHDQAAHYFVHGIGQQKNIDAAAICGGSENVARVETQTTFINGLLRGITVGIYAPQQVRVVCSQ